jgi:glycosyltransferase involved in cell wall biosynthesis
MGLKNGEGLLIEETPSSFAQAVLNVIDNQAYAKDLGMKGRKVAVERFSNQATYDRLTDFLYGHSRSMKDRPKKSPQGIVN